MNKTLLALMAVLCFGVTPVYANGGPASTMIDKQPPQCAVGAQCLGMQNGQGMRNGRGRNANPNPGICKQTGAPNPNCPRAPKKP